MQFFFTSCELSDLQFLLTTMILIFRVQKELFKVFSERRCSWKFQKIHEHLFQSLFWVTASLKRRPWHRCSNVNFAKFLRTRFFTSRWLLLRVESNKTLISLISPLFWVYFRGCLKFRDRYRFSSNKHPASNKPCAFSHSYQSKHHPPILLFLISATPLNVALVIQKQPPRCSVRKGVLGNFTKFTGKHLCQSLFLNKENKLWHRCFPVNFVMEKLFKQRKWLALMEYVGL